MFKAWLCSVLLIVVGWSGVAHATLSITPAPDFGNVGVSAVASTINETIQGSEILGEVLDEIQLGTGCTPFTVIPSQSLPFAVGTLTPLAVMITFDPAARGVASCTVTLLDSSNAVLGTVVLAGNGVAPVVSVTDSTDFGRVRASSGTQTLNVAVRNEGDQTMSISALSITGADFAINSPATPVNVLAGNTANVNITFDPSMLGTRDATLNVTTSDPVTPMTTADLTGEGGTSIIAVTDVNFGDVTDSTTATGSITVSNTGSPASPFTVSTATITGSAWFKFDTNGAADCGGLTSCSLGLTIGAAQAVGVRCTPNPADALTMQMATVTFTNTADSGDSIALLTCVAGRPNITVTPALAFGNVAVGQTGGPQTVMVQNTGNRNLTYTATKAGVFSPRYTLGGNCHTGCTVTPSSSETFTVSFAPNAAAQMDITVVVTSNDPDTTMASVAVTGRGIAGVLEVDPTTLAFGPVPQDTATTMTVLLKNTGNQTVSGITAVSNNTAYSVVAASLPSTLAAGTNATVTVRFAPTAAATGGNGNITFQGTWGGSNATMAVLAVTGAGTTNDITLSTATVDFMTFRYDLQPTRTFCITNTGQSPVTINSPITFVGSGGTATGELAIAGVKKQATCRTAGATVTLPQSLAATEVLEVTLRAQLANRIGVLTGDVQISMNLPSNPNRTVAVTGTGITAMMTVLPGATVNFGSVDIQGAPQMQTVRIRNTGAAPLDVGSFTRTPNAAFTFTLPTAATIAPAAEISFVVTYAPTIALAADETVTITHSIAGDINAPATGMIVLRGHPTDRDLEIIGGNPLFPDTFRNPGANGPVRTIPIHNPGTAPLNISSIASTDPDVWKVLDPDAITIPPEATMDVRVRFEPTGPGRSDARLQIVNDDDDDGPPITPKTTEVMLSGNCVDRRVSFNPSAVNVGYVEIGETFTIPEALIVRSMDDTNAFMIKRIAIEGGDGAFAIVGAENITLDRIAMERRFDVTFTPNVAGPITAKAQLFLDEDPVNQSEIELQGTAVFVDARGGGGCATGHGAGAGAILLVLFIVLRRRSQGSRGVDPHRIRAGSVRVPDFGSQSRKDAKTGSNFGGSIKRSLLCGFAPLRPNLWRTAIAVIALALVSPAARADDDNISLSVFEPTPQTSPDGFQLQSATVGAHGALALGAVYSYTSDPLVHLASSGDEQGVITSSSVIELGGAIALFGKLELGAVMPFFSQTGEELGNRDTGYTAPPADGTATGDLRLHAKIGIVRAPLDGNGVFSLATSIGLTLPTATDGMLTGVDNPSARVLALASLVPGALSNRLSVSANLGAVIRTAAEYKNLEQKSGVMWGLGASVRVADPLWISGEMYGEFVPSGRETMDGSSTVLSPIEWLAGLRWRPDHRFMISIAAGRGLTSAAGAPALRGVFALTFTPMAKPLAPIHAPPPPKPDVDSDTDGIFDRLDECDQDPEDLDLFEDTDGCPDLDNDKDGVVDAKDRCPLEPEDKDNYQDDDGCIEKDNDNDSILDAMDKCPNETEDKDGFQDADGCPEPDNDNDGILDAADRCPQERETINGNQDNDGCADQGFSLVIITLDRLDLMESIQYTKEKLKPVSYNLLGQIGATLRAHPEILRIRIGVHVAASNDEAKDQQLSEKRGQAIREWLVQWGIADKRLDVRGFGSTKPIGSGAANERVEIVIMENK